ncbi:MAG TPA: RyR domain-containing protein [Caulobacteraceae bacterium]|nr:RyR domain-containing protein [Caulobacteraceae bacterium]
MRGKHGLFPFQLVWLIPVAAGLTMALGAWGWLANGARVDDAVYRAMALFEINNDSYSHGIGASDWRFLIARWTGAFAVITSLLAVAALLHEQLATSLARWLKQDVILIGGPDRASGAFEIAHARRRSVLWLGAPAFGTAGLAAIALQWPAGDRPRTVGAHAKGARYVLVVDDNDADALALARAARAAAPAAQMTLLMNDTRLADEVAVTLNDHRTRVFSIASVAARALHAAHPPFLIASGAGQPRVHALIIGFGTVGQEILHDLIINCRTTGLGPPRIVIVDPRAKAKEGVLRVRAPELDQCAECVFIDGEIGAAALRPEPGQIGLALAAGGPLTLVYVCLSRDAAALSTASVLQSLLRAADVERPPIFVRLREPGVLSLPANEHGEGLSALTPFGDIRSVLATTEFLADAPDAAARAYHEAYIASLPPEEKDKPAARPWDELAEVFRRSNRHAVAHIPAVLASAGIALEHSAGSLPRIPPGRKLFEDASQLEALAELEHERWSAERRMDGWRACPLAQKQDRQRRLHPDLRPYGELPDGTKEFDRVIIRQTEAICARGG